MAAGDISLNILIGATDKASGVIAGLAGGGALGGVVTMALGATTALVGFGVASVTAASTFQSSMLRVQAYVGLTQQQTAAMGQAILQMAPALGQAPKALADGLYFVASAGFKGADALTVLRDAGMTAAASNTSATTTSFALVASLNALGLSASQAGNISDELNATVKNGTMTWDQYGTVVGKLAGSVSAAGGSAQMLQNNFTDLNAAMDVYTNSGISAHQASMWLNSDMSLLFGKAGNLATNAQKLGISFDASKFASMDFAQRLQYLTQVTGGNQQELVKLLGGNSQVANSVAFLNNHYGQLSSTITSITGLMKNGATTQQMFDVASQGLNFQVQRLQAAFQTLMITLGAQLLPLFTPLVAGAVNLVMGFTQLIAGGGQLSPALQNVAGMFTIMGYNWGQFIAQLASSLGGPLAQFGALMGSLLPGFLSQFLRALNLVQLGFMAVAGPLSAILVPALKILGQVFQGVQDAVEPVLNALEGQFIPAVQNLASAIAPIITSFLNWIADSGIVKTALSGLGQVVATLIQGVSGLVNGLANLINWLQKGGPPAEVVRDALIGIGVALLAMKIGAFIATVPALVGGFIAWAASAGAAAIATIAATWPILLIIAAIALLVVGIILLVQHWGQVVAFLQSTWQRFTAWFMGALSSVGAFFQGIWNNIVSFLTGTWNKIVATVSMYVMLVEVRLQQTWQNILATAQGIWNNIVAFFQGIWNNIVKAVQTAISTVVGWFSWLYNHNYYFKELVDFITNVITTVVNWLQTTWNNIVTWISGEWNYLTTMANMYWMMVQVIIQEKIQQVVSWLQGIWNSIIGWISGQWNYLTTLANTYWMMLVVIIQSKIDQAWAYLQGIWNNAVTWLAGIWNTISTDVSNLWGKISGIFGGAWNTYIAGPLGALWNSFTGWFGNLAGTAATWGKNLIQGFINGILGMLGNLGDAVGQILSKLASLLGFHSPTKEGEGRFITEWGKNMVKGFGAGIEAATPMLHAQIEHLIQAPGNLNYAGRGAGSAFALSSTPVIHVHIEPGEAHVHLDKREVGNAVMNFAAKELRTQPGFRGR